MRCRNLMIGTLFVSILSSSALAAKKIGTITAAVGVPVPLRDGDRVKTTTATAKILFDDSSEVSLDQETDVKVKFVGSETRICLAKGAIKFTIAPDSEAVVCVLDQRLELQAPSTGDVSIKGKQVELNTEEGITRVEEEKCGCGRSKAPIYWIVGGGAAGGAIALAARSPSEP